MKLIAFDTETEALPPRGTAKVNTRPLLTRHVCTTWAKELPPPIKHLGADLIAYKNENAHLRLFNEPDATFVAHNIAFDLRVLTQQFPALLDTFRTILQEGRFLDTRVLYLLRHPSYRGGVTLEYLAERFLNQRLEKGPSLRLSFRRNTPLSPAQRTYALEDATATLAVAQRLLDIPLGSIVADTAIPVASQVPRCAVQTPGLERPDVIYSRAAANLAWHLEPKGMEIDQAELAAAHECLGEERKVLQRALLGLNLMVAKKQLRAPPEEVEWEGWQEELESKWWLDEEDMEHVWCRRKGRTLKAPATLALCTKKIRALALEYEKDKDVTLPRTPKSGQISLARDDWKDFLHDLPPKLQLFMDYQKVQKYYSSFTLPLVVANSLQIFSSYHIPGAVTGRWSCTKPNLQQVPGHLRGIYKPRARCVLISADYPSLELYTLAHCMHQLGIPDGALFAALRTGDPHTVTAQHMYDKAEVTEEERFAAKACNFGLPGGMGPYTFMRHARKMGLDWDLQEARAQKDRWFNAFPDVGEYMGIFNIDPFAHFGEGKHGNELLAELGFQDDDRPSAREVMDSFDEGRVFCITLPSGREIPSRKYASAANGFFQGTGADVFTVAFNLACASGLPLVAAIHDSMILEGQAAEAESLGQCLTRCMSRALSLVCPSVPQPEIQFTITETWKK